jgi:hypothetical protein
VCAQRDIHGESSPSSQFCCEFKIVLNNIIRRKGRREGDGGKRAKRFKKAVPNHIYYFNL